MGDQGVRDLAEGEADGEEGCAVGVLEPAEEKRDSGRG